MTLRCETVWNMRLSYMDITEHAWCNKGANRLCNDISMPNSIYSGAHDTISETSHDPHNVLPNWTDRLLTNDIICWVHGDNADLQWTRCKNQSSIALHPYWKYWAHVQGLSDVRKRMHDCHTVLDLCTVGIGSSFKAHLEFRSPNEDSVTSEIRKPL